MRCTIGRYLASDRHVRDGNEERRCQMSSNQQFIRSRARGTAAKMPEAFATAVEGCGQHPCVELRDATQWEWSRTLSCIVCKTCEGLLFSGIKTLGRWEVPFINIVWFVQCEECGRFWNIYIIAGLSNVRLFLNGPIPSSRFSVNQRLDQQEVEGRQEVPRWLSALELPKSPGLINLSQWFVFCKNC